MKFTINLHFVNISLIIKLINLISILLSKSLISDFKVVSIL
ncbi:hypothetical protein bt91E135_001328 (plasmid) [Borrelia turicatae 91E135]|nr:hypothetical protein bt91E135_001328 [Borrelia turicatae 91E135]